MLVAVTALQLVLELVTDGRQASRPDISARPWNAPVDGEAGCEAG
jgi:hypothetical protein